MHAEMWHDRLRDEPRFQAAVEELWPYALGVLPAELRGELVAARRPRRGRGGRARHAHRRARAAVGRDDDGAALGAGGSAVVAEAQVWEALEEIPDPGDPRRLARRPRRHPLGRCPERTRPDRVHADVPRLSRARVHEARDGGEGRASGQPEVEVDPGRLVVDRQDHARRGARSCAPRASRRRRRGKRPRRSSSSCRRRSSAARTAARPRRDSRTSSARRRAARCATATAAASRSSSSRRSRQNRSAQFRAHFVNWGCADACFRLLSARHKAPTMQMRLSHIEVLTSAASSVATGTSRWQEPLGFLRPDVNQPLAGGCSR